MYRAQYMCMYNMYNNNMSTCTWYMYMYMYMLFLLLLLSCAHAQHSRHRSQTIRRVKLCTTQGARTKATRLHRVRGYALGRDDDGGPFATMRRNEPASPSQVDHLDGCYR